MVAIALAANSPGRAQTVHARRVALTGPSGYEGKPVWEPAIAAGRNSVIAFSNVGHRNSSDPIAYAVYEQGAWRDDAILDPNTTCRVSDPSIVFNPYTDPNDPDEFIAAALLTGGARARSWSRTTPTRTTRTTLETGRASPTGTLTPMTPT